MATHLAIKPRLQFWQLAVGLCVLAYLALGILTHTLKTYHWFLLLAIPGALFAAERGRRFFIDWLPLFAFWLGYDRLRLVQPHLLSRVVVEAPYQLEAWLFGWLFAGEVPPHALRIWLATNSQQFFAQAILLSAQLIYFSHIFIFPLLMLFWWLKSVWFGASREIFARHLRAFTILNALAILTYLLLPVAPPWWVSLYGNAQPNAELVAQTNMAMAMDGALVQKMIGTAPMWFGAVPSLHGAYPVLFFLLALRQRNFSLLTGIVVYGLAMWFSTVVLNQHYIIDLFAGAILAFAAYRLGERLSRRFR
ncbi:MAG: phosphatase PAP2 family protein [Acidobacteriota bacterium]